jgi:hypothetical protein
MDFRALAYENQLREVGVDPIGTKHHIDTKLAELKLEMIRWIVGTVGAAAIGTW